MNDRSFIIMRQRDTEKEKEIRIQALQMFLQAGFDGFSMQKLARAASVSPGTLYVYFKDREDLILSLYEEEMEKLLDATLAGFNSDMPFSKGLQVQWLNQVKYYQNNPEASFFLEQIRYSPFHERAYTRFHKKGGIQFAKSMKIFLENAVKNRQLQKMDLEVFWSIAYAPLYQLLKYDLHGYSFPGSSPFKLNRKTIILTLNLVLRALSPKKE